MTERIDDRALEHPRDRSGSHRRVRVFPHETRSGHTAPAPRWCCRYGAKHGKATPPAVTAFDVLGSRLRYGFPVVDNCIAPVGV